MWSKMTTLLLLLLTLSWAGAGELEELDREIKRGRHGQVDSILVVRHGEVVFERHYQHDYQKLFEGSPGYRLPRGPYNYQDPDWHPYYQGEDLHSLQSVTKTVTAACVGIAVKRGELNLDEPVARYVGVNPSMTLRDLLMMRAGIAWNEDVPYDHPDNDWAAMERSSDWLNYVLTRPTDSQPGEKFVYNSGATILIAEILRQATGMQVDRYAERYLFGPLGIDDYYWKLSPTGLPDTQGGLYLSPRSLARFGELYLNKGEGLFPEGWVKESLAPSPIAEGDDWKFGLHWWLLPSSEGYVPTALGYGGQKLFIIPGRGMVVVFTGWSLFDGPNLGTPAALDRILKGAAPSDERTL